MLYLDLFFTYMKVGFCSFGGLSMIPFLTQEMTRHNWLTPEQISDIVAIAEMTPGSLGINCATFVGIQIGGTLGAVAATIGVMTPSLTVCLLVAQFITRFKDNRYLQNALSGIRPVCLGMIVAVAIPMAGTNYLIPTGLSWQAVLIGAAGMLLLLRTKISIPAVIGLAALSGLILVR